MNNNNGNNDNNNNINSSLSNFEKVIDFNKTFDCEHRNEIQKNIFNDNPKLVDLRLKLIEEEVEELKEAIKNKDMIETMDALSDILYVVYGAGSCLGVDLNTTFNMVHDSNMSKTCKNEMEANETVKWYLENEKDYNLKNPLQAPIKPDYKKKNGMYIIFNKTTGKVLKSINYKKVNFNNLLL